MKKVVRVFTNDPERPRLPLALEGPVERVVTVAPKVAKLEGAPGDAITAEIHVVPEPKYAFHILEVSPRKGTEIRIGLEKTAGPKGDEYVLTVTNLRKKPGRFFDQILLKTDSPVQPEIRIGVAGRIQAPEKKP